MADKMMRIAGRTSAGTAVPMAADSAGNISTVRTWKKEWVTIEEGIAITTTTAYALPVFDVSGIPMFSLRFLNRLGVPVTVRFLSDINTKNGYNLVDEYASAHSITIPSTDDYIIITPDDVPILNYVRYVRMRIIVQTAPESGTFSAYAVTIS